MSDSQTPPRYPERPDEQPDAYNEAARVMAETEGEVDRLAQVIRRAHVMARIGRNSGFSMTPWETLTGLERAPYIASAVAVFRHWKGL